MRSEFFLLSVLAALLQTGCARFEPRPLEPAKAAADFAARSLREPGLRRFLEAHRPDAVRSWPKAGWSFEELGLAALYFHPDLDVARARLAVAEAGRETAGQRPNPTVAVTPGYNTSSSDISPWIADVSLDVPLEIGGKRGYRQAEAAHVAQAARWSLASTAWQVRARLRHALLALYAAHETRSLIGTKETLLANTVRLIEAQRDTGAVSTFEVTRARIDLEEATLARIEAEKQDAVARTRVADAIGIPPAALEGIRFDFDEFLRIPADLPDAAARHQALLNRTDILEALAEYAASESALQREIARQIPDVHLNPGYEFDQGDHKWMLGLSLELPLLNQNQGPIAEAEARRAETAARFNALQARALAEIEQALVAYRMAGKKLAAARSLDASSRQRHKTAQAMLELGEISRLELGRRELEVNAGALARLDALLQAQEALGDLEDALQSPASLAESLWLPAPRQTPQSPGSAQP
jgi:cobalt-zinc-cadmium efflux system outer membrane protein